MGRSISGDAKAASAQSSWGLRRCLVLLPACAGKHLCAWQYALNPNVHVAAWLACSCVSRKGVCKVACRSSMPLVLCSIMRMCAVRAQMPGPSPAKR